MLLFCINAFCGEENVKNPRKIKNPYKKLFSKQKMVISGKIRALAASNSQHAGSVWEKQQKFNLILRHNKK